MSGSAYHVQLYSGTSGYSGTQGPSGISGAPGSQGTSGYSGYSGSSSAIPDPLAHISLQDIGEVVVALGNISGPTTFNIYNGDVCTATATGPVTWTFSNPFVTGRSCTVSLILKNGGLGVQTWPVGTIWSGGSPPTLTAAGTDLLIFNTVDNGTTWLGVQGGSNFA